MVETETTTDVTNFLFNTYKMATCDIDNLFLFEIFCNVSMVEIKTGFCLNLANESDMEARFPPDAESILEPGIAF